MVVGTEGVTGVAAKVAARAAVMVAEARVEAMAAVGGEAVKVAAARAAAERAVARAVEAMAAARVVGAREVGAKAAANRSPQ